MTLANRILENKLLARLPAQELAAIRPDLVLIDMTLHRVLIEAGEIAQHLYFPQSGLASIVVPLASGVDVEVGIIGREGVIGAEQVHVAEPSAVRAFGQVTGEALQLPMALLRECSADFPVLWRECARFAAYTYAQAAQSAACNRQHEILARLARWLLQVEGSTGSPTFRLTHEFIAEMLGCRRPTVSVAANSLQEAGLISYVRGTIRIVNRAGLEALTCECYAVLEGRLHRLAGTIDGGR